MRFSPFVLKSTGYVISTISVILLATLSWSKALHHPTMMFCLLAGSATSIIGMFLRWLSYYREKQAAKGS